MFQTLKINLNRAFQNKIIARSWLFENETEPGVLLFSVQRTCVLQEPQMYKAKAANYISILSLLSGILAGDCAGECVLNGKMVHFRSNLVFDIR